MQDPTPRSPQLLADLSYSESGLGTSKQDYPPGRGLGPWGEPGKAGRLVELGLTGSVSVHMYAGRAMPSPWWLPQLIGD